jgi:hypothetical protein
VFSPAEAEGEAVEPLPDMVPPMHDAYHTESWEAEEVRKRSTSPPAVAPALSGAFPSTHLSDFGCTVVAVPDDTPFLRTFPCTVR